MKKCDMILKNLLALFLVLICCRVSALAVTLPVGAGERIKTVGEALILARSHDTIVIRKGVYPEYDLLIDKPLRIIGEEGSVIDGKGMGDIFRVSADSVEISGLILRNTGLSHTRDRAAIHLNRSAYFKVFSVEIKEVHFGILVEKSKDGRIENNVISGVGEKEFFSGNGIHLWHCERIEVVSNRVSGMRDGIYLEFVSDSHIEKNDSWKNLRYGLHFMFSNHDTYMENRFWKNGAGVAVMFSKFIDMEGNLFMDNWGPSSFGLLLKEIYDGRIEENTFNGNTVAIQVDGSSRISYAGNRFISNGHAIKITGGCYGNDFSRNDFIGNSFDVSYSGDLNENNFDGNYWSGYSGYDLNRDGTGDVPFRPVSLFSYVVNHTPETVVLLRSLFVDLINLSEKVTPVFTPNNLLDNTPKMKPNHD